MLKQWIARHINHTLAPFGYELLKRSQTSLGDYAANEQLALQLRALLPRLGISAVLDVGANKGQFYDHLREKVGYTGMVYSFEPIPELYRDLVARQERNWQISPHALGGHAGPVSFNVFDRSGWSSTKRIKDGQSEVTDALKVERVVTVDMYTLESALTVIGPPTGNIYLKLDTQGCDLDVLRGAGESLQRICAIQTELEAIENYEDGGSPTETWEFLRQRGFALMGIYPLWWAKDGRIGEMDAVFVRKDALHDG